MKTSNNNISNENKIKAAHMEQERTFGQAFNTEHYKPVLEGIKSRKTFQFGTPADTVEVVVKRECEGFFRICMKRAESATLENIGTAWETVLNTDRAAQLLSDYRADHRRAHCFKPGDLVRVNDEGWGQVNGHTGRIVSEWRAITGTMYNVEFVGELPNYQDGQPMKDNDFEPLDIEPVTDGEQAPVIEGQDITESADDIKVGDYVTINSDGRPAVVVRIGGVCGNYGSMLYLDDWTNWLQDCRKANGWNVVCTADEVTPITADMLQPTTDGTKDDYNVGDRVRHNHSGREAIITAVRVSATVKTFGNLRKVYRLDFGETVLGPFDYDLNGAEFVAEALTPLLPEPPKEVTLESAGEITSEPTLYERHNITADERRKRAEGSAQYIRRQARLAREAFYHHKGARIETSIAYRNGQDDPDKMSYKVCWYDETQTGGLHLVDCENGISLGQAARHMADFALLSECGLTLREILYPAA